MSAEL